MSIHMTMQGSILVISDKPEAYSFVRSALTGIYPKTIYASSPAKGRQRIREENVLMVIAFGSFPEEDIAETALDLEAQQCIPSILIVSPDDYRETMRRTLGHRIGIMVLPAGKEALIQMVNVLYQGQICLMDAIHERDTSGEKLAELSVISRAKLLLIEQEGLSEEEAHHTIEKNAMNKGLTKRMAAEAIIKTHAGENGKGV